MAAKPTRRSVADVVPQLVEQWDVVYNGKSSPSEIDARSWKRVWWKREECGHALQARVRSRTGRRDRCCPFHKKNQEPMTPEAATGHHLAPTMVQMGPGLGG